MKKIFLAVVVMGMVGCSSITELREKGPVAEFNSSKEAKIVATCVTMEWQKHRNFGGAAIDVGMSLIPDGYSIFTPNQSEVADIQDTKSGSSIKFYAQSRMTDWLLDKRIDSIKTCI